MARRAPGARRPCACARPISRPADRLHAADAPGGSHLAESRPRRREWEGERGGSSKASPPSNHVNGSRRTTFPDASVFLFTDALRRRAWACASPCSSRARARKWVTAAKIGALIYQSECFSSTLHPSATPSPPPLEPTINLVPSRRLVRSRFHRKKRQKLIACFLPARLPTASTPQFFFFIAQNSGQACTPTLFT